MPQVSINNDVPFGCDAGVERKKKAMRDKRKKKVFRIFIGH
jgi:hypothetical protein